MIVKSERLAHGVQAGDLKILSILALSRALSVEDGFPEACFSHKE